MRKPGAEYLASFSVLLVQLLSTNKNTTHMTSQLPGKILTSLSHGSESKLGSSKFPPFQHSPHVLAWSKGNLPDWLKRKEVLGYCMPDLGQESGLFSSYVLSTPLNYVHFPFSCQKASVRWYNLIFPTSEPDSVSMPLWDHLERGAAQIEQMKNTYDFFSHSVRFTH